MSQSTVIPPSTLDRWLSESGELALIDVRDAAVFGKVGEPPHATNIPAADLPQRIRTFVPSKKTRTVLLDAGDQLALSAASTLAGLGYSQIHVLEGGLPAWKASGFTSVFYASSYRFTQSLREQFSTPAVGATELSRLRQAGTDVVVLDSRPFDEYQAFHVPGAISVPGGELIHRFADVVPSEKTLVLVSCAGLPRAILGAQTLINAGVPNPVAFLYEGTRGWENAGLALERGDGRTFGALSNGARDFGQRHADRLAKNFGIRRADPADIDTWLRDQDTRTTYLLDVRTPEEYAADHLLGAISAPGGQLPTNTLRYVSVRGARLVLVDDTGVRAVTVAHWLQQRGWEVWTHATENPAPAKPAPAEAVLGR